MNLVLNAFHAMEGTAGKLHIELRADNDRQAASSTLQSSGTEIGAGGWAQVSISDNGYGMDKDVQARIFDPFFTTKKQGKGTGLGLSTVQDIMSRHGGTISVTSQPGAGSTFTLSFPCIDEPVDADLHGPEETAGGNERILVVDDDTENTFMMADMLSQLGYDVSTTNEAIAALHKINTAAQPFELVITDYSMPDMNGDELAARIRGFCPQLPIIIMTGFEIPLVQEGHAASGTEEPLPYDTVLGKPFSRDDLDLAIRASLANPQP